MKRVRVLHVSTAHSPYDPRIVFKQCRTLAAHYEVFCALPNADPAVESSICFIRLPYFRRVIWRIMVTCPLILLRCLWLRPRVVHVYVAEFLPFAYFFRLTGAKIIYEVQENLHKKMHLKAINNGWPLAHFFRWFDRLAQRRFYLIFTEHGYLTTYKHLAKSYQIIYNYPFLPLLEPFRRPYAPKALQPIFLYIGWLSFERAFDVLVEALGQVKTVHPCFDVHLFGKQTFTNSELNQLPHYHLVKKHLHFHGYTDQRSAFARVTHAVAGLALLKPIGDYPESYTTKLFEYMALGLPVVTADFPLYQAVVDTHRCGFCVSCTDANAVAQALIYLIDHPHEAREMGRRGRLAVEQHYTWASEADKLLRFYENVLIRPD